ncbi:LysE family translocator [Nocardioides mangrovicus]|uniref:LysE family translocator n=1 Tax=Nocardioides mangrovicus TaxID=2478913 RepID=A0A3L8P113_9ACTN|nr:LysE family translocator [Nocardioides mangrovicus]RLV48289.1 LysE family translocator [Nocardioides mangrovicus]
MPSLAQTGAFLLASFLFIQVPGPSLLFTIGRALSVDRREALTSVAGNAIGLFMQVVCVAVGLAAVVAASATAYTVVKVVGACYVLWLGVQAIRHRGDARRAMQAGVPLRRGRPLWIGFTVGLTNPKTIVFFVAFLPQFTNSRAAAAPQLLLLGAVFAVIAVCSDSTWALLAARARDWFAGRPQRLDRLGGLGGALMVALGVTMLVSEQ